MSLAKYYLNISYFSSDNFLPNLRGKTAKDMEIASQVFGDDMPYTTFASKRTENKQEGCPAKHFNAEEYSKIKAYDSLLLLDTDALKEKMINSVRLDMTENEKYVLNLVLGFVCSEDKYKRREWIDLATLIDKAGECKLHKVKRILQSAEIPISISEDGNVKKGKLFRERELTPEEKEDGTWEYILTGRGKKIIGMEKKMYSINIDNLIRYTDL